MKSIAKWMVVFVAVVATLNVWADDKQKNKVVKKPVQIPVYLGYSKVDGGMIRKPVFDSLVRQGLTSRDSNGRMYKIEKFRFTFCERNIYEDADGKLMPYTDYTTEYAYDNKLMDYQLGALITRTKKGDTVIFEDMTLKSLDVDSLKAEGKQIKLIITR